MNAITFYCLLIFAGLVHHRASCGEAFPWLLELDVAKDSPKFLGSVFVRFESDGDPNDGIKNNFKTEEQTFDIQLKSGDIVRRELQLSFSDLDTDIRVGLFFASFSCDKRQRRKLVPVRLSTVKLISGIAGHTFIATNIVPRTAHAIGDCANVTTFQDFTVIEKWIVSGSVVCFFDGKFYRNEADVKAGCRQKCQCKRGVVECVANCQDEILPDKNVICRSMNALGTCCPKTECRRNSSNFLDVVKCQSPKAVLAENDESEIIIPPWTYFIIVNRYSANNGGAWCGATLVDENWILTPAHCLYTSESSNRHYVLTSPSFVEVYKPNADQGNLPLVGQMPASKVTAIKIHPSYQRLGDETAATGRRFSSFDFALLKLTPPIRPSKSEQPINLPWTSECYQFVDNARCQISSTRYFNDTLRLVFEPLLASSLVLPSGQCHKGPAFFCYDQQSFKDLKGRKRGHDGSGAVVKRNGFYELVGLILSSEDDWRSTGGTGGEPRSTFDSKINILSICEILQWINSTVTTK